MRNYKRRNKLKIHWQRLCWAALLVIGIIGGDCVQANQATALSEIGDCVDVQFIFARGSGEELFGPSYTAWRESIIAEIIDSTFTYDFYELGDRPQGGHQYQAVPVAGDFWGYVNLVDAFLYGGEGYFFGNSVREGAAELAAFFDQSTKLCPNTRYVLGGYSQGAMTILKNTKNYPADKIIYMSLFGDPKLFLPEGQLTWGDGGFAPQACRSSESFSSYREYVPDCHAYSGILNGTNPYHRPELEGKVGLWCNKYDIMCSSGMNIDDHTSYESSGLYREAARTIRQKLMVTLSGYFPTSEQYKNLHDLVLLFDTTNSMLDMINKYKAEALSLGTQVLNAGGRVALYEYRDAYQNYYPKRDCNFGCDQKELEYRLDNIKQTVNGGTDLVESLLHALKTVMKEVEWRNGATKTIVVLTDDFYHIPDKGGIYEQEIIDLSLSIDPVNIYVITKTDKLGKYQFLTEATNGRVFDINDNLSDLSEMIYYRPVARLDREEYFNTVGGSITFDASKSYGFGDGELSYEWDLDGTNKFVAGGAQITKTYDEEFDGYIQVRISDNKGSSTMSAHVQVVPELDPVTTQVNVLTSTVDQSNAQVEIDFTTDATSVLAMHDEGAAGFVDLDGESGHLTVKQGLEDFTLRLVPFAENGYRGEAREILIPARTTENDDSGNKNNNDDGNDKQGDDNLNKNPANPITPPEPNHDPEDPTKPTDQPTTVPEQGSGSTQPGSSNPPILNLPMQTIESSAQAIDKPKETGDLKAPDTGSCNQSACYKSNFRK